MIACRPLFRVDRAWKFTNTYVISNVPKPIEYLQACCSHNGLDCNRKMSSSKDMQSAMDHNKKRKTVNLVWRPVCTQASSSEECLVKNVSEDGDQVQEVNVQHVNMEAEAVNKITDSTISYRELQDNDEVRGSMLSAEKHSISVDVGSSLIRFIKGKGESTQKKIEEEMGVRIIFPSSKRKDSVIIEGISIESVTRASEKIQAIIDEAVKSPNLEYSHFVSLPLAIHPELVDKLFNFQNSILGNSDPDPDENLESDSNKDTSEDEDKDQQKGLVVAAELKVEDGNEHVKVDLTNIRLTSYQPKASKSSTLYGIKQLYSVMLKELSNFISGECGSVLFIS